jgi:hypothetical protein
VANTKCMSEATKSLLAKTLDGCTPEQARAMLWEACERSSMDPRELLGLDVDRKFALD